MKNYAFYSFARRQFPCRVHLIDESGTRVEKTALRVIDNDFVPGLSWLSFWGKNRKDGNIDGCLLPASAR